MPALRRIRWGTGHSGGNVSDVFRRRNRRPEPGVLLDFAAVPSVPRKREADRKAMFHLPRARDGDSFTDHQSPDSTRGGGWFGYPCSGQRRARRQRWSGGRSHCWSQRRTSPHLPPQGTKPDSPGSHHIHGGGTWYCAGDSDLGRAGQAENRCGHTKRKNPQGKRKGRSPAARQGRRPAGYGRGSGPPEVAPGGQEASGAVCG